MAGACMTCARTGVDSGRGDHGGRLQDRRPGSAARVEQQWSFLGVLPEKRFSRYREGRSCGLGCRNQSGDPLTDGPLWICSGTIKKGVSAGLIHSLSTSCESSHRLAPS